MVEEDLFENGSHWVLKDPSGPQTPRVIINNSDGTLIHTDWGYISSSKLLKYYTKQGTHMTNKTDPSKGMRFNSGKPVLSMVLEAKHAMEGCAKVLMFGAKKYNRGNWHKGLSHTEIMDSMLRHQSAYLAGEVLDPESGLRHVDHIMCNAMFLAENTITHPELDDRSDTLVQRGIDAEMAELITKKSAETRMSLEEVAAHSQVASRC